MSREYSALSARKLHSGTGSPVKGCIEDDHSHQASEVEFVHPISAGGSVKFVASCVNFSIFTHSCVFLTKTVEIR